MYFVECPLVIRFIPAWIPIPALRNTSNVQGAVKTSFHSFIHSFFHSSMPPTGCVFKLLLGAEFSQDSSGCLGRGRPWEIASPGWSWVPSPHTAELSCLNPLHAPLYRYLPWLGPAWRGHKALLYFPAPKSQSTFQLPTKVSFKGCYLIDKLLDSSYSCALCFVNVLSHFLLLLLCAFGI